MPMAVSTLSRKVGDSIQVFDNFNGYDQLVSDGTIVRMTKAYVHVQHSFGTTSRFHRATGFCVGYSWPHITYCIAPETSK